jgi:hypothetical protein
LGSINSKSGSTSTSSSGRMSAASSSSFVESETSEVSSTLDPRSQLGDGGAVGQCLVHRLEETARRIRSQDLVRAARRLQRAASRLQTLAIGRRREAARERRRRQSEGWIRVVRIGRLRGPQLQESKDVLCRVVRVHPMGVKPLRVWGNNKKGKFVCRLTGKQFA